MTLEIAGLSREITLCTFGCAVHYLTKLADGPLPLPNQEEREET